MGLIKWENNILFTMRRIRDEEKSIIGRIYGGVAGI